MKQALPGPDTDPETATTPERAENQLQGHFLGAAPMMTSSAMRSILVIAASVALGACVMDAKPELSAVQPAPVPEAGTAAETAAVAPWQVAAATAVMSDGSIIPVPRARPDLAGLTLSRTTAADAAPAAPLGGPPSLVEKAAAYRAFDVAIDELAARSFKAPRDVRAALDALRPHEPEYLAEGWIANSAFLAASQPTFAAAIRGAVARDGKRSVLAALRSGSGVWMFDGAQEARALVVEDAAADYRKLTALGQRFLTTAMEFQRTRWGAHEPAAPFSIAPQFAAAEPAGRGFAGILAEIAGVTPAQAAVPVMQRILSLAGHIAVEAAATGEISELTENRDLARCARFARLNLNQCLAASRFPSEEAYCTGKHAMNEVASCWALYIPAAAQ